MQLQSDHRIDRGLPDHALSAVLAQCAGVIDDVVASGFFRGEPLNEDTPILVPDTGELPLALSE
jgi:hypothetical protein